MIVKNTDNPKVRVIVEKLLAMPFQFSIPAIPKSPVTKVSKVTYKSRTNGCVPNIVYSIGPVEETIKNSKTQIVEKMNDQIFNCLII